MEKAFLLLSSDGLSPIRHETHAQTVFAHSPGDAFERAFPGESVPLPSRTPAVGSPGCQIFHADGFIVWVIDLQIVACAQTDILLK